MLTLTSLYILEVLYFVKQYQGNLQQNFAQYMVMTQEINLIYTHATAVPSYIREVLKCFNNRTFFNVVCVSWTIKCWILLMHGVTMKFTKTQLHHYFI